MYGPYKGFVKRTQLIKLEELFECSIQDNNRDKISTPLSPGLSDPMTGFLLFRSLPSPPNLHPGREIRVRQLLT